MNSVEELRLSISPNLRQSDKVKIPCLDCGKERWVSVERILGFKFTGWCVDCRRKHHKPPKYYKNSLVRHRLNRLTPIGYAMVSLPPSDPFIGMANRGRIVLEHRLVVAEALGRCLNRREIVHHINRIKNDNRIQNLTIVSNKRHEQIMALERRIDYLERLLKKSGIPFNGE